MVKIGDKKVLSWCIARQWCERFKNEDWSIEDQRGDGRMLRFEGQERTAAIEKAFHAELEV